MTADPLPLRQHCRLCGFEKPIDEFPRMASSPSGRDRTCLVCKRAQFTEWRRRQSEASRLRRNAARRGAGYKDHRSPESRAWHDMKQRCRPSSRDRAYYADRGIQVCDRWQSLELFLADMGPKPSRDHELDRIDNDVGYEPSNCRWATRDEQMRNTRSNAWLTVDGKTMIVTDWAIERGISRSTIRSRLKAGWTVKQAIGLEARRRVRRKAV